MRDIALKVVPLDRTVDEEGQQLKDTKHIGACPYDKTKLYHILRTPIEYPCQHGTAMTKADR